MKVWPLLLLFLTGCGDTILSPKFPVGSTFSIAAEPLFGAIGFYTIRLLPQDPNYPTSEVSITPPPKTGSPIAAWDGQAIFVGRGLHVLQARRGAVFSPPITVSSW